MNNPNQFPLNLKTLQRYAKRWADELPGVKGVRLYHYSSFLEKKEIEKHKSSVKYAVVFHAEKPDELWSIITDDEGVFPTLIDAAFVDVYQTKPDVNYLNDWVFTTSDLADGNQFSSVMVNEPYWTLFPISEEYQIEADGAGIEFGTKLHAYDVKKRWGIDKIKLADYVLQDGLRAFDEYGRQIPTVEMIAILNSRELWNNPELQKEFIADQIKFFITDDVLNFEYDNDLLKQAPAAAIPSGGPQLEPLPDNCLIDKKLSWTIRFQGIESDAVKNVVGMRYIERLLDNPGKSYSCSELLELHTKKDAYRPSMSEEAAIGQGLYTDHGRQEINDPKAQGDYWKKQIELENEKTAILDADDFKRTPEDVLRLKEIEQELSELKSSKRDINFKDKVSDQQSLVRTNLKKAYEIIQKDKKMADFMKHVKDDGYIKADGAYGYVYMGNIKWGKCK